MTIMTRIHTATIPAAFLLLSGSLCGEDSPSPNKGANAPDTKPASTGPVESKTPEATMEAGEIRTKSSYGFGYRNGRTFMNQTGRYGLRLDDLDREQFLKGLFDALELKESEIEQEKINDALNQLSLLIKIQSLRCRCRAIWQQALESHVGQIIQTGGVAERSQI